MKNSKLKISILGILCALSIPALQAQNTTVVTDPIPNNPLTTPPTNTPAIIGDITSNPTISGGFQEIYDAALGSTNFAVALGGGRGIKGNNNLIFADYLYNFNANAGLLLGFDDIGQGTQFTVNNTAFVKGGINLQASIAPFKNFGATNFIITPFGSLLMSSSGGDVGEIAVGGANWRVGLARGWYFNLGGFYENRMGGNTATDGVYICGHVAVSKGDAGLSMAYDSVRTREYAIQYGDDNSSFQ